MDRRSSPLKSIIARCASVGNRKARKRERNYSGRRLRLEALEDRQMLSITVNNPVDERDGSITDGDISLRDAILEAPSGSTIDFAPALNGVIISLTLGEVEFGKNLTIDASTLSNGLTIDAGGGADGVVGNGNGNRIFNIADTTFGSGPPLVTIIGLKLTGGDVDPNDYPDIQGGAIRSTARLVLQDCTITGNYAPETGAVWVNVAQADPSTPRDSLEVLKIDRCMIDHNIAFRNSGSVAIISGSETESSRDTIVINNGTVFAENGDPGNLHGFRNCGGLYARLIGAGDSTSSGMTVEDTTFSNNLSATGAGMLAELSSGASLSINHCEFAHNSAVDGGGFGALVTDATIDIVGSRFIGNAAVESGGAITLLSHYIASNSAISIADSKVTGNTALQVGGGIYCAFDSNVDFNISDSLISGNVGQFGGGVGTRYVSDVGSHDNTISFNRTTISGNTATFRGGGLNIGAASNSTLSIVDCAIRANKALDEDGGGMYCYLYGGNSGVGSLTITGSELTDNTAGGDAGALEVTAIGFGATAGICNSTISGNTAVGVGGGVKISTISDTAASPFDFEAQFENVTISNNRAATGAAIYSLRPTNEATRNRVWLTNSIAWGNYTSDEPPIQTNLYGSFDIDSTQYNIIGLSETYDYVSHDARAIDTTLHNNVTDDPKLDKLDFYGGLTRTHRPFRGSPVIDVGLNSLAVIPFSGGSGTPDTPLQYDQRGFARFYNVPGVNGSGAIVDIGAHEVNGGARIVNVELNGVQHTTSHPDWATTDGRPNPISFAELVAKGEQLKPIFADGTNRIRIVFTDYVEDENGNALDGSAMELWGSGIWEPGTARGSSQQQVMPIGFDSDTFTWTFAANALRGDRYRIDFHSEQAYDLDHNRVDGHWASETHGTLYNWRDDPAREFAPGNGTPGSCFQFMFALFPGDYNQNGVIDAADEVLWADYPNESVEFIDGSRDQTWTAADYAVWQSHFGDVLGYGVAQGDYNGDGVTDANDWVRWKMTYGNAADVYTDADGNGSSVIDTGDYTIWRFWEGTSGAWGNSECDMVMLRALVDSTTAPKVMNVTISGSNSTHDPYSFENHVGSGEQLRTVPVGGADTVSITFDQQVNVEGSYLRVVGFLTAELPELAEFSYDAATMTATWRFENWIANDIYVLSLSDAVTNTEGYRLDGEWMNPGIISSTDCWLSVFPSGDGHAGGSFSFLITLFAGDANLDNLADSADYDIWANYLSLAGDFTAGDFNGDGVVGLDDFALWELAEGRNLQGGVGIPSDLASPNGPGDVDWRVDDSDFEVVRSHFGTTTAPFQNGDITGDGHVDMADVDFLLAQFGLELSVTI